MNWLFPDCCETIVPAEVTAFQVPLKLGTTAIGRIAQSFFETNEVITTMLQHR